MKEAKENGHQQVVAQLGTSFLPLGTLHFAFGS